MISFGEIERRSSIPAILAFLLMLNLLGMSHLSWAQTGGINNSFNVYPNTSKPYGLTYGEWTAKWWQWLTSIPSDINPASDTSGIKCTQKQAGPVWLLAGSTTGKAERSCTIPAGKAILFLIIGTECSYAEYPKLVTESDLRGCAVSPQNGITHIQATVDGVSLQNSQMPRVQSPLFDLLFSPNNIFGAAAGASKSVADGYYLFLEPLSPGKHEIVSTAGSPQFTTTSTTNFAQVITYHLTVQ